MPTPPSPANLPIRIAPSGALLQHVTRTIYRGQPPYFGAAKANRYDAPDGSYGVLYLAHDLPTALMESVFHAHTWRAKARRSISYAEVLKRLVLAIEIKQDLALADLCAPGVMAAGYGLNLNQLTRRGSPRATQSISKDVHGRITTAGYPTFDGILYPSRNNFPGECIALFDRAATKITVIGDFGLDMHVDWPAFVSNYRIGIV